MIIGVTGGIGTGKSHISNTIGYKCGICSIDSDSIIREILMYYIPIATQVTKIFGDDSYINGKVNIRKYYKTLYGSRNNSITMNNIILPYLIDYVKDVASRNKHIILDCPIIFDTDIHKIVNYTILVKQDMSSRIRRLMGRHDDIEIIKSKIESESFDESKANFILTNDGRIDAQIEKVIKEFNI